MWEIKMHLKPNYFRDVTTKKNKIQEKTKR